MRHPTWRVVTSFVYSWSSHLRVTRQFNKKISNWLIYFRSKLSSGFILLISNQYDIPIQSSSIQYLKGEFLYSNHNNKSICHPFVVPAVISLFFFCVEYLSAYIFFNDEKTVRNSFFFLWFHIYFSSFNMYFCGKCRYSQWILVFFISKINIFDFDENGELDIILSCEAALGRCHLSCIRPVSRW